MSFIQPLLIFAAKDSGKNQKAVGDEHDLCELNQRRLVFVLIERAKDKDAHHTQRYVKTQTPISRSSGKSLF